MAMRLAADIRGRRVIGAVATVAAAAAAVGLAVPAMAAPAAPAARSLSGGQTAPRWAVPWRKVGPGWALAMSSRNVGGEGVTPKAGPSILYLVKPEGGRYIRYKMMTWSARDPRRNWQLLGWSGDLRRALFASPPGPNPQHIYQLQLRTGKETGFNLPAKVTALGYTRPEGLNILAEKSANSTGTGSITLQRYSLRGKLQKDLVTFKQGTGFSSVASNSNGTELALGTANGLELISNAGGVIRKLPVGNVSCNVVRWWSSTTVLASCMVTNGLGPRMWLVPASGARPTALTPVRTANNGVDLGDFNAWKLSSGLYVDGETGCGAGLIGRQPAHGKEQVVNVPGAPSSLIVNATRSTLMVERISECSPATSLVWFNPATRKMTVAIGVSHHQIGVTAVVPYFIAGKF